MTHADFGAVPAVPLPVSEPRDFYDQLADDYHLMFRDWWESARRQGEVLGSLLARHGVAPPAVLDASFDGLFCASRTASGARCCGRPRSARCGGPS